MKHLLTLAVIMGFACGTVGSALAQTAPPTGTTVQQTTTTTTTTTTDPDADADDTAAVYQDKYGDPVCGVWQNGVWQGNGHCPSYAVGPHRARVAGTITIVKGHLVTVQQSDKTVVINDQPALNRQTTGKVAVGRAIVAYGYWAGDNFYATTLRDADAAAQP